MRFRNVSRGYRAFQRGFRGFLGGFLEFNDISGALRDVLRGYRACFRKGSEAPNEVSGVP